MNLNEDLYIYIYIYIYIYTYLYAYIGECIRLCSKSVYTI